MAFPIAVKDTELYPIYATYPNTMELVFCFDMLQPGEFPFTYRGVRGCLDKVTVEQIAAGMYKIQIHDIFGTDSYAFDTPQPVQLSAEKLTTFSTMRIQQIQFSLSNFESDQVQTTPSNIYAYVWYWNPDEFPVEMALADPSIRNSVVITLFDRTTGNRVEPSVRMRGNVLITVMNTFDNARLIPKEIAS